MKILELIHDSKKIDIIGIIKDMPSSSIAVESKIKKKTIINLKPPNLNAFFDI